MAVKVDLLGETLLADGRFKLTLTSVEVAETDGATRTLSHEIYHQAGAAALLLFDPTRGTVLLVRQFRLGAYLESRRRSMIEVCAGMLDADAPEAAVVREAMEETGVSVARPRHVFDAFASPGATTEKIACFVAQYRPADRIGAGGGVDADERIEIIEPSLAEALDMIGRGEICDAKTIALLYYARAQGLMDRAAD
ncbi:MAG: NUDIX domain-containing protein [Roseiarcus sp.]|jgi:nudix-type nucleoside diphosphatase (YffH/AdpP family)